MAIVSNNHEQLAKKLIDQADKHFANISKTRYWMAVAYYEPDDCYNVFFNIKRDRMFTRSLPVAIYQECSQDDLIKILKEFRKKYQFTIEFSGFSKEEWRELRDSGLTK